MLEIKIQENSSVDKEEILNFYLQQNSITKGRKLNNEEIENITKFSERFFNSPITKNVLAFNKEKLVGWLGFMEVVPPTILLNEFHPIINSKAKSEQITIGLLQKCFEYAKEKKICNVRIFNDVTEEKKELFQELEQFYLKAGMTKTHVVLCMENRITNENLKSSAIDNEYHIEPWKEQTDEALTECYTKIFSESFDNFTNSLDEEERKYWNTISRGKSNEASIVIKKDNELVAIILAVDYGDYMELGPIGVVPNHRGKKLGKILMEECLASLLRQDKTESYLEVDQTNIPAIKLYESYGFKVVSKKHGFLWRKKNQ